MSKATISPSDRLKLIGLLVLAEDHNQQLKNIVRAGHRILNINEEDDSHWTDAVYCNYEIHELLNKLDLEVDPILDAIDSDGEADS